mmetsp:Transcript_39824/g.125732  ORF Transcript_39824/g.125732 Transcript_39824/m.125732 type:complete len:183 (+) Transcript_39824:154-702(+)
MHAQGGGDVDAAPEQLAGELLRESRGEVGSLRWLALRHARRKDEEEGNLLLRLHRPRRDHRGCHHVVATALACGGTRLPPYPVLGITPVDKSGVVCLARRRPLVERMIFASICSLKKTISSSGSADGANRASSHCVNVCEPQNISSHSRASLPNRAIQRRSSKKSTAAGCLMVADGTTSSSW